MRHRSKKMQRIYVERRKLVADLFDEAPWCTRCGRGGSDLEPHELLPRGRGGSILDPANVVLLCHTCHRLVTDHAVPDWDRWILASDGRGNVA